MGHAASESAAETCLRSITTTNSELTAEIFPAVTPDTMFDCEWRWPDRKRRTCDQTNLTLTAYKNLDVRRRIACAQSHWLLWQLCVGLNEPICVLEHDAVFVREFRTWNFKGGAISINSPIGATFGALLYDQALVDGENEIPWITNQNVPQGLPGNSAYVIQPWAAQQLMDAQQKIGWWPNDAIMCRQLFPWLRAVKPYYTNLQSMPSTTCA